MPRRPRIRRSPTPFARLLLDYMHAHYPMDQSELAELIGIAGGTMSNWLKGGKLPRAPFQTIPQISQRTGIPEAQLYESVGLHLGSPVPPPALPTERSDPWDLFLRDLLADPRLTDQQKMATLRAAYERRHGISATEQWIAAEHRVEAVIESAPEQPEQAPRGTISGGPPPCTT